MVFFAPKQPVILNRSSLLFLLVPINHNPHSQKKKSYLSHYCLNKCIVQHIVNANRFRLFQGRSGANYKSESL